MFEYQEELISEFYDKSGRYLGRWFILHAPETGGDKAFELLRQAMKQENKIAVAKTVMGQKGMLLAVIPTDGGILIETVFYADEIKELPKEYSYPEVNEAELAMAKTLINSMNQEFQPELYKDEYQERLKL